MDRERWTGNRDARILTGVPRPFVHQRLEWHDRVDIGADLMDYVPDRPCAPFRELLSPFDAGDRWWSRLRSSLDALAGQRCGQDLSDLTGAYRNLVVEVFGQDAVPAQIEISTQHADLHWGHLTVPDLHILDWERWGPTIHGLGPATLYCYGLLVPEVAVRVGQVFGDVLDSPSGRFAQLCVIADRIGHHGADLDDELDSRMRHLADDLRP
jgi:hypothetical protein